MSKLGFVDLIVQTLFFHVSFSHSSEDYNRSWKSEELLFFSNLSSVSAPSGSWTTSTAPTTSSGNPKPSSDTSPSRPLNRPEKYFRIRKSFWQLFFLTSFIDDLKSFLTTFLNSFIYDITYRTHCLNVCLILFVKHLWDWKYINGSSGVPSIVFSLKQIL